ncbi:hypothetical protein D9615_005626 [Tricholomella constricta]|uniref:Mug135-like C-terminal domain-containing protein n=1 Tax=Tricholomella constricta TaxID=117010 RepID=A0A8H5HDW3_9AGAR|nr:hypothetical protein D9615_005626 [Tricholomella constricta]
MSYKKARISQEVGTSTKDQVGAGAVYESPLIAQHAGGDVAPPWFAPTENAIMGLSRLATITHNLLSGDGHARPFVVVPFPNGAMPTDPPHNLPALVNVAIINALTGPQSTAYLQGYGVPVPNQVAARRTALRAVVGCTVEV